MLRFRQLNPHMFVSQDRKILGFTFKCPFCETTKLACFLCVLGNDYKDRMLADVEGEVVLPSNIRSKLPLLQYQTFDPEDVVDTFSLVEKPDSMYPEAMYMGVQLPPFRLEYPGHWSGVLIRGQLAA